MRLKQFDKEGNLNYTDEYLRGKDTADLICACKKDCLYNCKGECGCIKCEWSYRDFLTMPE